MEGKQQTTPAEREKYEAPAGVELGTVAALTQSICGQYPSQCD